MFKTILSISLLTTSIYASEVIENFNKIVNNSENQSLTVEYRSKTFETNKELIEFFNSGQRYSTFSGNVDKLSLNNKKS